jgi:anhydro-N-acetylmuramic acid kinase
VSKLFAGLISGTSRDGVDAVLACLNESIEVIATRAVPYPKQLAGDLRELIDSGKRPDGALAGDLNRRLGEIFAQVTMELLAAANVSPSRVTAVGSHGQTVWHEPTGDNPLTIQLGDPRLIANLTGIPTVADFRSADIRAGGEGAPLAPLIHRALLRDKDERIALANLGGIANVTLLEPGQPVRGWDTGPANCLLDGWIRRHQKLSFDDCGRWASGGDVIEPLLECLLADPYFRQFPPKSTGVEYFNMAWLDQQFEVSGVKVDAMEPRNVQTTLAELTAVTVANAVAESGTETLLVCGGGVHNTDLVERLQKHLPGIRVISSADRGVPPDWVEALLFAWLAGQRLSGIPQDTRSITGASEPVLLGEIFYPDT